MKLADLQIPNGDSLPVPSGIPTQLQGGLQDTGKHALQTGLDLLFIVAAVLAVIFVIFSGIEWISSQGDPSRIESAKKRLFYAIIGLIVVALAFLIFNAVSGILGKSSSNLLTP